MGITNAIRGAGHRVMSVGRAVQAASKKLDTLVQPQTAQPMQPQAPQGQPYTPPQGMPGPEALDQQAAGTLPAQATVPAAAPQQRGFALPDLGPAPDANSPEFKGTEGQKKYEMATSEYQHKVDIHQAFQDLDQMYVKLHPQRDFQGEYQEQLQMQQQQEGARPKGSNLARFALALGDQNPAVKNSNLDSYNQNVDKEAAASDQSFSKRMMLRAQMHEKAAADAEQQGNFRKALAEQEKLALLKADEGAQEHKYKMGEIGATQEGATNRANIRADAMRDVAKRRADTIASTHDLSGTFLAAFEKEAAKAVAKFVGPHDLNKEYTSYDVDSLTTYLEHLAEMFHDQQHGTDDGGAGHLNTPPGKRKQAASGKEEF